jgi:hypothetical protein
MGWLLWWAPHALPASPAVECARLTSVKLANTTTIHAEMLAAGTFRPPDGTPSFETRAFCRVSGAATPSADSNVKFQVWMPVDDWNGRLWGVGNGNFAGYMPYKSLGTTLAEGYAVVGTDTGHEAGPTDASWAIGHPEKLADFGYRAIHEVSVRAKRIVTAFYGRPPAHAYFSGCSNGGRQALMEAQRYPDDYDGILAGAPALDQTGLNEGFAWIDFLVIQGNEINLPSSKLPAIQAAALAACDKLDGVEDGVIEDPRRCGFDPAVLLCAGAETDRCLTKRQVSVLKKIYTGIALPGPHRLIHGYSPGAEAQGWDGWIIGKDGDTGFHEFALSFFRGFVFGDPRWDYHRFDLDRDSRLADRRLARLLNATQADIGRFAARGGRLIVYHGWEDPAIPPLRTIDYYDRVRATMGPQAVAASLRLFMVPGMLHCLGGPGPNSFGQFAAGMGDPATRVGAALQRWVEAGIAPERILAAKRANDRDPGSEIQRTRPLCAFPNVAHYRGSGSTDDATNFDCARP